MDVLVEKFILNKEIGNANVYKDIKQALKWFAPENKPLPFSDVNVDFLNRWETYCRDRNMSETSISVYFRTLRAVFNRAIADRIVSKGLYPFNSFKISKFETETRKRAISREDIRKIEALDVSKQFQVQLAKDVFVFSFYNQGMNLIDIAHLRWSQIEQDRLRYTVLKRARSLI